MAGINPLRYRGYYYDYETGFYYLQSCYYDPANHRFINADNYASTGQGFVGTNMFAYCNNNPVNRTDEVGTVSSSTEDNNNNGIPDYLEIRWRKQTLKAKSNLASDQETGFTVIAGGTLRAAMGVFVSVSVYCAFDMHGNLALYVSPGIGGGFPSASLGAFFGAISAPDANNIDGMGFTIGGSLCEGVKGGGDYIMAVDKRINGHIMEALLPWEEVHQYLFLPNCMLKPHMVLIFSV